MSWEIEILWEVEESMSNALKKLSRFHDRGIEETLDIYYTHASIPELKPSDDERLVECLRVRVRGGEAFLTHKRDHFLADGTWTHSDECETKIDDDTKLREILTHLGFTELVRIESHKHTFATQRHEVVLEDVKKLGVFLEIETKDVRGNVEDEKGEIRALMADIGIRVGDELNAGKPELMLRKRSR